jgi:hypothetical protein
MVGFVVDIVYLRTGIQSMASIVVEEVQVLFVGL